ncbi:MAG: patatin-like phospholipase family protein [Brasilonema angustatum HA4187-MV1]|jgi:NTE family protein|nr:patatin-like phospholipase family protein [Brasilonema angustatum HA4187-MV1]
MPMEAYAILDGGGVKGAALVGCLQAAKDHGIKFIGYGGTSAGSIVALLASVGYSPEDIKEIMIEEINFNDFLDGTDKDLERFKKFPKGFLTSFFKNLFLWQNKDLIDKLNEKLGLCDAITLTKFLLEKIKDSPKVQNSNSDLRKKIEKATDINFQDLKKLKCDPLKVVASDLISQKAVIYPQDEGEEALNYSVIKAVRASMCFPFVFTPVRQENGSVLVDGGLSSNLPIFLFQKERSIDHKPVIAFDLCDEEDNIAAQTNKTKEYQLGELLGDMLATVLESSDDLLRQVIDNIYHVRIPLRKDIDTLDFSIDKEKRKQLFDKGHSVTSSFIVTNLFVWKQAKNTVERLQALHAPPRLVQPILKTVVRELEESPRLSNCRSYIMLPTDEGKFAVVYQYGMDDDPDIDWEIEMNNGGAWSEIWNNRKPNLQNIEVLRKNISEYNITKAQVNKIPKDKKTTVVVPIFDWKIITELTDNQYEEFQNSNFQNFQDIIDQYALIGILCIDTSTPTRDILNSQRFGNVYRSIMVKASILSGILR